MSDGTDTLEFAYGNGLSSVIYNGTEYWYVFNAQNDVIGLIDENGEYVVEYTYDAWGAPLSKSGTLADTLGTLNPFRYRGYIYDEETGWYYCQSRYYDPAVGRWLNADKYLTTGQGFIGNNMYAYCLNNPLEWKDITGNMVDPATLYVVTEIAKYVLAFFAVIGLAVGVTMEDAFPGLYTAPKTPSISMSGNNTLTEADIERLFPSVKEKDDDTTNYSIFYANYNRVTKKIEVGPGVDATVALSYLMAGLPQSFMCTDYTTALLLTTLWGDDRWYEIDKGKEETEGYFYHFHENKNSHGDPHIWHYGPKGSWVNNG